MTLRITRARAPSLVALAIAGAFCVNAQAADEPPASPIIKSLSVADARAILADAGATVDRVDLDADGFTITATLSPDRHVWFEGTDCKGVDQSKFCTEFKVSAGWELDSAAHEAALAKQLDYNYTSVSADGANLNLWRMDFIYDGVTQDHLRNAVLEFLELRRQAEDVIWPPAKNADPLSPKRK